MGFTAEKFYFKGQKISKQTINKLLKWETILSAIKSGSDNPDFLKERCGRYAIDTVYFMKKAGLIKPIGRGMHTLYTVTEKGEQLIEDVKQYRKEKKNEQE